MIVMEKEQYLITRLKKKESQPTSSSAPYNPKELQIRKENNREFRVGQGL
jgi:hypothetical protein